MAYKTKIIYFFTILIIFTIFDQYQWKVYAAADERSFDDTENYINQIISNLNNPDNQKKLLSTLKLIEYKFPFLSTELKSQVFHQVFNTQLPMNIRIDLFKTLYIHINQPNNFSWIKKHSITIVNYIQQVFLEEKKVVNQNFLLTLWDKSLHVLTKENLPLEKMAEFIQIACDKTSNPKNSWPIDTYFALLHFNNYSPKKTSELASSCQIDLISQSIIMEKYYSTLNDSELFSTIKTNYKKSFLRPIHHKYLTHLLKSKEINAWPFVKNLLEKGPLPQLIEEMWFNDLFQKIKDQFPSQKLSMAIHNKDELSKFMSEWTNFYEKLQDISTWKSSFGRRKTYEILWTYLDTFEKKSRIDSQLLIPQQRNQFYQSIQNKKNRIWSLLNENIKQTPTSSKHL